MDDTTVQQAPAPSAPAPSVSSSVTTTGTMSARDALALADSSSATPETPATPAETPAAAIAQPAGTETPADESATTPATGEPPKWRWQDILANARDTSAKEAEARVRQELDAQYGGLKDFATLDPTERNGLLVLHRAMAGDAQSRALVAQAQPSLAQSLGWIQAQAEDAMPEADLQTGDGTPVYSATQQAKRDAWLENQITKKVLAQFDDRLKPVNEVISAHQTAKAHADVASVLTEMRADADFKAHEADIKATLKADAKLWALADSDPKLALELAWARVYRATVLPRRDESTKAAVLANLQQRAAAGTTNPGTATTSAPPNVIGNAREALRYAESVVGAS